MDEERARFDKALEEVDFAFRGFLCCMGYHPLCDEQEGCRKLSQDEDHPLRDQFNDLAKTQERVKPTFEQHMYLVESDIDHLLVPSEHPLRGSPQCAAIQILRLRGRRLFGFLGGALMVYLHSRGFELGLMPGYVTREMTVELYIETPSRVHLRFASVKETMERGVKRLQG